MPQLAPEKSLRILDYPHPTLRHVSKPLRRVDAELARIIREMFVLMYDARGIGLAANQVDLPYRLFVLNVTGDPAQRDQELVFINPVLSQREKIVEAEEGCLSLTGLYADVKRPDQVTVEAYNLSGEEIKIEAKGLFARAVQHETDHLDGVLFIDRLSTTAKLEVKQKLDDFEEQFGRLRERGEIPSDRQIAERLAELERLRT